MWIHPCWWSPTYFRIIRIDFRVDTCDIRTHFSCISFCCTADSGTARWRRSYWDKKVYILTIYRMCKISKWMHNIEHNCRSVTAKWCHQSCVCGEAVNVHCGFVTVQTRAGVLCASTTIFLHHHDGQQTTSRLQPCTQRLCCIWRHTWHVMQNHPAPKTVLVCEKRMNITRTHYDLFREAYQFHGWLGRITALSAYLNIILGIFLLYRRDTNYNESPIYNWPSLYYMAVFVLWTCGATVLYKKLKRGHADMHKKEG